MLTKELIVLYIKALVESNGNLDDEFATNEIINHIIAHQPDTEQYHAAFDGNGLCTEDDEANVVIPFLNRVTEQELVARAEFFKLLSDKQPLLI